MMKRCRSCKTNGLGVEPKPPPHAAELVFGITAVIFMGALMLAIAGDQ